ncbi:hypothetical protein CRD36_09270 [Paremcibacter congregatus]|uniref:Uncharacterized protein n=2 Tax=Paremcibacter congregatus TaxID=2043170 RepID=A0A2G4YRF9_9PROT|nr:hypothetical protein CRD36_09270 [Paremcibacter congregatus]
MRQGGFLRPWGAVAGMVLCLAACTGNPTEALLKKNHQDVILPGDFGICKGYGCRRYVKTGLAPEEWRQIENIFVPAPVTAETERQMIRQAIALFERFVGPKTGTDQDAAGAVILNFSTKGQMDCIDEAFNSSTYLHLLRKAGLVRFHALGAPLHRGNYITRWPHNTATIHVMGQPRTIKGEGHFVVDSWFHKNGDMPEIIPAAQWAEGWSPDQE